MDIALFGVGQHTENFINIITYFGGTVICLADNDKKKTGSVVCGIEVISPQLLVRMNCKIIVSCIYCKEIELQLSEMGIGNRLISLATFLKWSVISREWNGKNCMICMDLYSKSKWGGAENWNVLLANELAKRTERIAITCTCIPEMMLSQLAGEKVRIKYFRLGNAFGEMVDYYQGVLPFVFVNSFYGGNFFAVLAVKKMYPEKVRIINVVHNDRANHYRLAVMFDDWIDQYLCVSSRIKKNLVNTYGVAKEKVEFLYQPINLKRNLKRAYNYIMPLQLGMASRLVKEQKRCDLIPQLIRCLELLRVDYVLNIAGDGELFDEIHRYVSDHDLSQKVRLLGRLSKEEMIHFWKAQDIYINISEYEGTSLSMLEAMWAGCVPLVTDVSGTEDFIRNQYNGFICGINDISAIADRVKQIDENRDLLKRLGMNARKEILSKCSLESYADRLSEIIRGGTG